MEPFYALTFTVLRLIAERLTGPKRTFDPLVQRIYHRFDRLRARLNRLFQNWRAGSLPRPHKPRFGRTSKPNPERPKFPTASGWLRALLLDHQVTQCGEQLAAELTSNAEYARFLAEVPQAGRLLRPLFHMLGAEPPAVLKRDPLPRKPRAPRPRLPPLQPHASTSPLHLRLEVPGIPNRRRKKAA